MKKAIGIDIGATLVRIAFVDEAGHLDGLVCEKTIRNDVAIFLLQIEHLIDNMLAINKEVIGIGIGIPGPVAPHSGYIATLPNIGIGDFDILDYLKHKFDLPITIINDANAAAFGEAHLGAGKGYRIVQYVTLSTGIGGGLIFDGKIYAGINGYAQEVGNTIIDRGQPKPNKTFNRGAFESWCSGSSLMRMAREKGFDPQDAGDVFKEPRCSDIIKTWIDHLAIALGNIVNMYEPQVIILGGGVMKSSDLFFDELKGRVKQYIYPGARKFLLIKKAMLDQYSGLIGAGLLPYYTDIFAFID